MTGAPSPSVQRAGVLGNILPLPREVLANCHGAGTGTAQLYGPRRPAEV